LLRDEPLDNCGKECSGILTKNILLADFYNEKILCHTNTNVETKILAIFSEPKKIPVADTSNVRISCRSSQ